MTKCQKSSLPKTSKTQKHQYALTSKQENAKMLTKHFKRKHLLSVITFGVVGLSSEILCFWQNVF